MIQTMALLKQTRFRWPYTCFAYKGKTGEEHHLLIFKGKTINKYFIEKVSARRFH